MTYISVQEFKDSVYFNDLEGFFTNNEQISGFLEDVCGIIDDYCGRSFATGTYTDEFTGNNTGTYFTHTMPLISVESITYREIGPVTVSSDYEGFETSTGSISSGAYSVYDTGMIKSRIAFIPSKVYTVNYTAGYNTIPRPIKTATFMLAKILADSTDTGNLGWADGATLANFKFGKFSETYVTNTNRSTFLADNLPPTIAIMLRRFRYGKSL
jgi:hypothetical protein